METACAIWFPVLSAGLRAPITGKISARWRSQEYFPYRFLPWILGIPVLSWLYGVNLKEYKLTLLLLLLCGGVNAINIIFYYVLAIMRKQKYMTILYIIVCLVSFLIMDTMTGRMGLMGASLGYLILVSLLAALLLVYIIIQTRRNTKNE